MGAVRERLKDIDGLVEVFSSICNLAADRYERDTFILPQEKFGLLRVRGGMSVIAWVSQSS
jgi:hypothetical protein